MGRVKEVFMQMYYANDGVIPEGATIGDLRRMQEMKIFQWQEYEREKERIRSEQSTLSNSSEITKVAKVQDYWQAELKTGKRRKSKKD